jgi:hypothetical protein
MGSFVCFGLKVVFSCIELRFGNFQCTKEGSRKVEEGKR